MRDKAIEFLKSVCKCNETDSINYKPYEGSSRIITYSFNAAVDKFMEDLKDIEIFFNIYGIFDKAKIFDGLCGIWKKHLIVY